MLQCQALLRWPDYVRIRSEKQEFINLWMSLSPCVPLAFWHTVPVKTDRFPRNILSHEYFRIQ